MTNQTDLAKPSHQIVDLVIPSMVLGACMAALQARTGFSLDAGLNLCLGACLLGGLLTPLSHALPPGRWLRAQFAPPSEGDWPYLATRAGVNVCIALLCFSMVAGQMHLL